MDWHPRAFQRLLQLIGRARNDPSFVKRLHSSLIEHRLELSRVLAESTADATKQQDLSKGRVWIHGTAESANESFCKAVGIVAEALGVDCGKAATIYNHALAEQSSYGDLSDIQVSFYLYFVERESLLTCLETIIEFATSSQDIPPDAKSVIWSFTSLLLPPDTSSNFVIALLDRIAAQRAELTTLMDVDNPSSRYSKLAKILSEQEIHLLQSRMQREVKLLGMLAMAIAQNSGFNSNETLKFLQILQKKSAHDEKYILNTILMNFGSASIRMEQGAPHRLKLDMSGFKSILECITAQEWSDNGFLGVIWLGWICYLERAVQSPSTEVAVRLLVASESDASKRVWFNRVGNQIDVYRCISNIATNKYITKTAEKLSDPDIESDLHLAGRSNAEGLVNDLVVCMKRYIRDLLACDQDKAAASDEQTVMAYGEPVLSPQTSWEALLLAIGEVYQGRPDAALHWWTKGEHFNFLKLASNVWTPRFLAGYLNFIKALAWGSATANRVHDVLNNDQAGYLGKISWNLFFRTLINYVDRFSQSDAPVEFGAAEKSLLYAFLGLTARVVTESFTARRVLAESQHFRALSTLFSLLVARLDIETKSYILKAITAFCSPQPEGRHIVNHVWILLEQTQIIPTNKPGVNFQDFDSMNAPVSGLIYDLSQVEMGLQTYPETMAFLELVKVLMVNGELGLQSSIYEQLGSPERIGGVKVYIDFVINSIFLKLDKFPFKEESEKWGMTNLCLEIFSHALASMELPPVVAFVSNETVQQVETTASQAKLNSNPLISFGLHPGYKVLCATLEGGEFTTRLFDTFRAASLNDSSERQAGTHSILKILHTVLANQESFIQIIAPAILDSGDAVLLQLPESMTMLENLLAYESQMVVQLASFINVEDQQTCLLALEILYTISKSPTLSRSKRLLDFLQNSDQSNQILQGFVDRLRVDEFDVESSDEEEPKYLQKIRICILDMLIWNIVEAESPNIAHFLLGLVPSESVAVSTKRKYALHSIVDMSFLGFEGEKILDEKVNSPFFESHPKLAEKCYKLINLLCDNGNTSPVALRYLRVEKDFFFKQLEAFFCIDDSNDERDKEVLVSRLRQSSSLMKIIAVEMQVMSLSSQRAPSIRLLNLLFGIDGQEVVDEALMSKQGFEQPLPKAIDFLRRMNFGDAPKVAPLDLSQTPFAQLQLTDFVASPHNPEQYYDISRLGLACLACIQEMDNSDAFAIPGTVNQTHEVMHTLLDFVKELNKQQEIAAARVDAVSGWCNLMCVVVMRYSNMMPFDFREAQYFSLLSAISQKVNQSTTSLTIGDLCAQTSLIFMSKICEGKEYREILDSDGAVGMGRLGNMQQTILCGILDSILVLGSPPSMRGNSYVSLVSFLQYVKPPNDGIGKRSIANQEASDAYAMTISTINGYGDRLLTVLCRDACDSLPVWQIVAYMTLGIICEACNWIMKARGHQHNPLLDFLTKRNFLVLFLRLLVNTDDKNLQATFPPLNLNMTAQNEGQWNQIKSVVEMKLFMFLRISATTTGAECLLGYGIMEALTEFQYLDQYPEVVDSEPSMMKLAGLESFNDLFSVSLELVTSVLSHLPPGSGSLILKANKFVMAHQDTFISVLKDTKQPLTLSSMNKVRLVTALFALIGGGADATQRQLAGPGHHSFQSLLLIVLKIFSGKDWMKRLKPSNELEEQEADAYRICISCLT